MCNIETVAVASSGYNSRSRGKPYLVSCPCSLACEYKEQQLLVEVKQPHFVISFSSLLSSSPPVCECVCARAHAFPAIANMGHLLPLPPRTQQKICQEINSCHHQDTHKIDRGKGSDTSFISSKQSHSPKQSQPDWENIHQFCIECIQTIVSTEIY